MNFAHFRVSHCSIDLVIQIMGSNWRSTKYAIEWKTMKRKNCGKITRRRKQRREKNCIECDRGQARSWVNGKYEHKWNVFKRDYKENYSSSFTIKCLLRKIRGKRKQWLSIARKREIHFNVYNSHTHTLSGSHSYFVIVAEICAKHT